MTLTDTQVIRAGRVLSGSAIAMAVGGLVVAIVAGRWEEAWLTLTPVNASIGIGFGVLAWTILPRQPRNRSVWAYAVAAFFGGLYATCLAVLVHSVPPNVINDVDADLLPAELTWQAAIAIGTMSAAWIPGFLLPLTIGLLLFPDGQLPSPRWRWVGWYQATTLSLAFLLSLGANHRWSTRPAPQPGGTLGTIAEVFINLALLGALLGIASLVVRYRHGDAVIRHQIRWIAVGGALIVVSLAFRFAFDSRGTASLENAVYFVPLASLILSFWVAITKYRLYEIDVIISKSVTYLGLAAVITGLYVLVVLGPLLLIDSSDESGPGLLLPILATGAVAIAFEPVRTRMQRFANRLVYGERATPYEVLSQVTARLADTEPGSGTEALARLLADGTGADSAVVWLRSGDVFTPDGVWHLSLIHI